MSLKAVQRGNRRVAKPGTNDQTGNIAPKFPWSRGKFRALRVLIACIAYRLDKTDDSMARLRDFPPISDTYALFRGAVPWFEQRYNEYRERKAAEQNYDGPLEPLNAGDVHNRLHYMFAQPGSRKHSPHPRLYGISVEHHDSTEQHKEGGRTYVFARCSTLILRRLTLGLPITEEEIKRWSR